MMVKCKIIFRFLTIHQTDYLLFWVLICTTFKSTDMKRALELKN